MANTSVIDRCRKTFSTVLDVNPSEISDTTSPATLEKWDSLAHVQLILALEKEFSISIPPDESVEVETFKSIHELVSRKLH